MKNGYKVASINIEGKLRHEAAQNDLLDYLIENEIDIAMIQETNLIPQDEKNTRKRLRPYYSYFESNPSSRHQGVAILITRKLSAHVVSVHNETRVRGRLLMVVLDIQGKQHALINIYMPASEGDGRLSSQVLSTLEARFLHTARIMKAEITIMGDWNVELFGDRCKHPQRKEQIWNIAQKFDLEPLENDVDTWISHNGIDTSRLDHCITSIRDRILEVDTNTHAFISTDHRAITIEIPIHIPRPFTRPCYRVEKQSMDKFNDELESSILDGTIGTFMDSMATCLDKCIKKTNAGSGVPNRSGRVRKIRKEISHKLEELASIR